MTVLSHQYYYLASGLPELNTPEWKAEKEMDTIQKWICENLTPADRHHFNYLIYRNDNKNLLFLMRQHDGTAGSPMLEFQRPAVFSSQELEEGLSGLRSLPSYMETFIEEQKNPATRLQGRKRENRLITLYYNEALALDNEFLYNFFFYKRDLKNILSALNAVKYGYSLEDAVIGDYDTAVMLKKNQGAGFGLAKTHPYITELKDMIDLKQLDALEKRIDELLYSFVDRTLQGRFSAESVFAYFIKLSLGNRWILLEEDAGMEALNHIVKNVLRTGVWPEEFSQTEINLTGEN